MESWLRHVGDSRPINSAAQEVTYYALWQETPSKDMARQSADILINTSVVIGWRQAVKGPDLSFCWGAPCKTDEIRRGSHVPEGVPPTSSELTLVFSALFPFFASQQASLHATGTAPAFLCM